MMAALLDRWAHDTDPFDIRLGWETLPAPDGSLHLVDPAPDAQFENYPVSLCGRMLLAKDGVALDSDVCPVCIEVSHEREADFQARLVEVRELSEQAALR